MQIAAQVCRAVAIEIAETLIARYATENNLTGSFRATAPDIITHFGNLTDQETYAVRYYLTQQSDTRHRIAKGYGKYTITRAFRSRTLTHTAHKLQIYQIESR